MPAQQKILENYIHLREANLNLKNLKNSCYLLEKIIIDNFTTEDVTNAHTTVLTKLYSKYNLFLYPLPEFNKLFFFIRDTIREIGGDQDFYIQCWLNIYRKGDFIDWHSHWPEHLKTWHGFFCVDCEPSVTTYKIPKKTFIKKEVIVDVNSKNNLLVISKSDGDSHRTWAWEHADRDRITIAFDIVPRTSLEYDRNLNHWVPI